MKFLVDSENDHPALPAFSRRGSATNAVLHRNTEVVYDEAEY